MIPTLLFSNPIVFYQIERGSRAERGDRPTRPARNLNPFASYITELNFDLALSLLLRNAVIANLIYAVSSPLQVYSVRVPLLSLGRMQKDDVFTVSPL